MSAALVSRFAVTHRVDDRQLIRDLSGFRQGFSEPDAIQLGGNLLHFTAIFERRVGLRIERLLMSHASRQENVNDRLRCPLKILVILQVGPGGLQSE